MKNQKRNHYSNFDIILPTDTANLIDDHYSASNKIDTYRMLAYIVFRVGIDGKKHELSSEYLKRIIPSYRKYRDKMLSDGIISTDNKYLCSVSKDWKGEAKCKAYRINSTFESFRIISVSYPKIIDALKGAESVESASEEDVLVTRIANQRMKPFRIDTAKAISYLCARQRGQLNEKAILEEEDSLSAFVGIMRIHNGFYYTKSCPYGRIHTNFTCLDSNIKMNCIHLESGERLVHIDIKNSQPSILGAIMRTLINIEDPKIKKELDLFIQFCKADLYEGLFLLDFALKNMDSFENESSSDWFKETFKNELETKGSRKKSKSEVIKMLFDEGSTGLSFKDDNIGIYLTFKKLFRHIYEKIQSIKEDGYKKLAHQLQRFESRKILHPLILFLDSNNIDFISIHDSIVVKDSVKDRVIDKFREFLSENHVITELEVLELNWK